MRQFRTLSTNKEVQLIDHIKEYQKEFPDMEILIGCDSQNRKRETVYAIVVGLYRPSKGAHVLYSRFTTPRVRITENINRLLNEVWFSVEIAEAIKTELGIVIKWIDIDINADEKYKSNVALSTALGLVKGMGYNVRHKNSKDINGVPMMCYCADSLVK